MSNRFYDSNGRPITLGRELGRGGEGAVFEVAGQPQSVAKVYHQQLAAEKLEKLRILPSLSSSQMLAVAAWPTATLADAPQGTVRGIVLPRVSGREIHYVYSPAQRRQLFPKSDWAFLVHVAMNAAAAVQTVHDSGVVIGDINYGGVFVSEKGIVRLIECDSFQIRAHGKLFRCTVGVPHFTAPELQGADFTAVERTPEQDSFGLGVLVFHLLFMGRHPFAGRYLGPGDMTIEQAISERRFAFSSARLSYQMDVPLYAPHLQLVPPPLADLFERTFRGDALRRPSSAQWFNELQALKKSLRRCAAEPAHQIAGHLPECPWCRLEKSGIPPFFVVTAVKFDFDAGFDLDSLWRQVEQLSSIPQAQALVDEIVYPSIITPRELPQRAKFRSLGPVESIPAVPPLELVSYPELPTFQPTPPPDDPQSGFRGEPVPIVPAFVPEPGVPASDPELILLRLPAQPNKHLEDHLGNVLLNYKNLKRGNREYQTAKWGTLGMCIGVLICLITPWRWWAFGPGVTGLGFALTWLILWIPLFSKFTRNRAVALSQMRQDRLTMDAAFRLFNSRVESINEENSRRKEAWGENVRQLEERRARWPALNAERKRSWDSERLRIEAAAAAAQERNREKLKAWQERTRLADEARHCEWEARCQLVQARRAEVEAANQQRRSAWERRLEQHNARVRAISELNDRRQEAKLWYDRELSEREQSARRADAKLQQTVLGWFREQATLEQRLSAAKAVLGRSRQEYLNLKAAYKVESDVLNSGLKKIQQEEFLRQQLIEDADIPGLGKKRKVILAAFGIETAYEITAAQFSLLQGRGFGPKSFTALEEWRRTCERRFVFQPNQQVNSPPFRTLHARYQAGRTAIQTSLQRQLREAQDIVSSATKRKQEVLDQANKLAGEVAQSTADLNVARLYAV